MAYLFRTLIVTAADAPTARAIAAAFGPGGVGMWQTPLSASGSGTPTHYISTGYIPAEFVALAPIATWEQTEGDGWIRTDYSPGNAATVALYAQQSGLPYTEADIEGVHSRSDVSAEEPFLAMGRMGLKIMNTTET